jgi:hypothetical protein
MDEGYNFTQKNPRISQSSKSQREILGFSPLFPFRKKTLGQKFLRWLKTTSFSAYRSSKRFKDGCLLGCSAV